MMRRAKQRSAVRQALVATSLAGVFVSCLLMGCMESKKGGSQPAGDESAGKENGGHGASQSSPANQAKLTAAQSSALEKIRVAGGQVKCRADGLPELIDLASERVYADDALVKAVLEFPALSRLRLAVSTAAPETLSGLGALGDLDELMLQDAAITDDQLANLLGAMPKLKRLVLRRLSRITDDGVRAIAALPHLEVLALIEIDGLGGAALNHLQTVRTLRSLDLRNCGGLESDELARLSSYAQLTELKIGGPAIDDGILKILIQLPRITSLSIEDAGISGDGLRQLSASGGLAGRLKSLTLARCFGITDAALQDVAKFSQLNTLVLRDLAVTGAFLKSLSQSQDKLPWTTLVVTNAYLNDEAVALIPQLAPGLKRLDLRGNLGVTDASVQRLQKLASLEETHFEDTGVTAGSEQNSVGD